MDFSLKKLFNGLMPRYERLRNGSHRYTYVDANPTWDSLSDKLKCGSENPVLLPILQLISHYLTKVEFQVKNKTTGKIETDHPLINLLNNPNFYQSKQDFLRQYIWLKYCIGYSYMYPISPVAFNEAEDIEALYNLDTSLVTFPKGFKTSFVFEDSDITKLKDTMFKYDPKGQNLNISIKDIIPFYDLPNGISNSNLLTADSRLDALKKPLTNISRAFDAKNIAIKSNGKEMFSNKSGSTVASMPLGDEEKKDIQDLTNEGYGLASNRSRSIITNADIQWKSLHIDLKELGLDDSVVKDAQMCVSAFNVPKELISYDGKGAKYENQVQATIGFIQGLIQDEADDICNSFSGRYDLKEYELIGSFDHLPIMQVVKNNKMKSIGVQADTLKKLLDTGADPEEAKVIVGFDKLKLVPKSNGNDA